MEDARVLISTGAAAQWMCISSRTIVRMLVRGDLKGVRVGGHWKVYASSVVEYLENNKATAQGEQDG